MYTCRLSGSISQAREAPFAMYSSILLSRGGKLSDLDRISTTKSGQSGAKPSCSSSVKESHLSRFIQAASGDGRALLGRERQVEESKRTPERSMGAQATS